MSEAVFCSAVVVAVVLAAGQQFVTRGSWRSAALRSSSSVSRAAGTCSSPGLTCSEMRIFILILYFSEAST